VHVLGAGVWCSVARFLPLVSPYRFIVWVLGCPLRYLLYWFSTSFPYKRSFSVLLIRRQRPCRLLQKNLEIIKSINFLKEVVNPQNYQIIDTSKGSFGSQPQFAKSNFGIHKLFGLCLVFTVLVVCHTLLIIWSTCPTVNYFYQFLLKFSFQFLSHTL
jgi:hypothetical protein